MAHLRLTAEARIARCTDILDDEDCDDESCDDDDINDDGYDDSFATIPISQSNSDRQMHGHCIAVQRSQAKR